ncbi:hypothetical protein QBC37DRAFT_137516 [Rhypophila decipiens]|uniref:Uncharacterized protein n=1 Tax=Rhypophila decipiens TaxID=261697 RepID=A0AAN6YHS2_9PEZI|nr:hypothetical protein QBC37DRAFT_137516 [Rhypophila decipiens]
MSLFLTGDEKEGGNSLPARLINTGKSGQEQLQSQLSSGSKCPVAHSPLIDNRQYPIIPTILSWRSWQRLPFTFVTSLQLVADSVRVCVVWWVVHCPAFRPVPQSASPGPEPEVPRTSFFQVPPLKSTHSHVDPKADLTLNLPPLSNLPRTTTKFLSLDPSRHINPSTFCSVDPGIARASYYLLDLHFTIHRLSIFSQHKPL